MYDPVDNIEKEMNENRKYDAKHFIETGKQRLVQKQIDKKFKLENKEDLSDVQELKNLIVNEFAAKNPERSQITEWIEIFILKTENIYTIRQDDNLEMWIYVNGIYVENAITHIKEWCKQFLGDRYTSQLVNQVVAKIEVETYIEKDEFFKVQDVNRIAVLNGILDLNESKLCPFNPKEIFFNKINAEYNTAAKCPNILNHFKEVLSSEEDIPVIEELFGYCLYRDYKIEKAFMLTGDGRNGKGKTVELLKFFLNPDNCCNVSLSQLEKSDFAMVNFHNKLANIAADISNTALKETGNFKQLTGHDMISANRKKKSYINFVNYAKLIFCANELPKSYDDSNAFWNRWVLLQFPYTFLPQKEINGLNEKDKEVVKLANPEQIKMLTNPIEMSGLLNLAIAGLKRLLTKKDFSYSSSVNDVKNSWIRSSDSATSFFMDHVVEDFDHEEKVEDVRKEYSKYCKKYKLKKIGERQFNATLKKMYSTGLKRIRNIQNDYYVWEVIRINPIP